MKQYNKYIGAVFFAGFISTTLFSQPVFFTDEGANKRLPTNMSMTLVPEKFRTSIIDIAGIKNFLWSLPSESAARANRELMPEIELPMPDGKMAKFHVWESSMQEPALQAKFPDIKTFAGQGIDDRYATVRFVFSPLGFNALVLTPHGSFCIIPYTTGMAGACISYYQYDLKSPGQLNKCMSAEVPAGQITNRPDHIQAVCRGTDLRTYKLAMACTGEFAQANFTSSVTPIQIHAAIVTIVSNVNVLFESEFSVRFILVANNDLLEFINPASDPYVSGTIGGLLTENQTTVDTKIGNANYDIGHVLATNLFPVQGFAAGQVCSSADKARAFSCFSANFNTPFFYTDILSHEMTHQFTAAHTFNSNDGSGLFSCNGNRVNSSAFETGGGTSIMAYPTICGNDVVDAIGIRIFHPVTFDAVSNDITSGIASGCGTSTPTGNILPVIAPLLNNGVSIPPGTPFILSGTATDANGDALTYSWDEIDQGVSTGSAWNSGTTAPINNTEPLFKSILPKTNGTRSFPDTSVILAGYPANPAIPFSTTYLQSLKGETLSPVARPIKFRLTVRDNRAGGGGVVSSGSGCQATGIFQVNVEGTTPFTIASPNGGESYAGGSIQTISWNPAGTAGAPFNAVNVRVLLSTDGGLTYPTTLIASTPNDGSQAITIPVVAPTSAARIKIEAIGNIFFDISNGSFSITPLILPVELTEFKGSWEGKNALLEWTTASEYNTRHFELEKSTDGTRFNKIATVTAAGNSNSPVFYSYIDRNVFHSKNYYRLRMVDTDDNSKWSTIVQLKYIDVKPDMQVLGDLFTSSITVRFTQPPVVNGELSLTDMSGRMIARRAIALGEQQVQWILPDWKTASGVYILKAVFNEQVFTTTVTKR